MGAGVEEHLQFFPTPSFVERFKETVSLVVFFCCFSVRSTIWDRPRGES